MIPAALADIVFSLLDSPGRSVDMGGIIRFAPDIATDLPARLRKGLDSARGSFPKLDCVLQGKRWVRGRASLNLTVQTTPIEQFMNEPLQLGLSPFVQLLVREPDTARYALLIRMHHALGDAPSCLAAITHQLMVAFDVPGTLPSEEPLKLKAHPHPVRSSPYAFDAPPDSVWVSSGRTALGPKHWKTFTFDADRLRRFARSSGSFSYNDVLMTLTLDALTEWNRGHGIADPRLGIFLGVDLRQFPFAGFGNGIGRIRIYSRFSDTRTFADRCRRVREQVEWSRRNGEWSISVPKVARFIPKWLLRRLVLNAATSPRVDRGSVIFTHVERMAQRPWEELFPRVESLEVIPPLTPRYPLQIAAATLHDTCLFTIAYNVGLFTPQEIERIGAGICDRVEHEYAKQYLS